MTPAPATPRVLIRTEVRMPLTGAPLSGDPSGSITFTIETKDEFPSGDLVMSAPKTVAACAEIGDSARPRVASSSGAKRRNEDRPWPVAWKRGIGGTVIAAGDGCNP